MIDNYSCTSPPLTHPIFNLVYWSHCHFGANSWDTRGNGGAVKPTSRVQAHEAEVNAVAFAPHNENILITGSADKVSIPSNYLHLNLVWDTDHLFYVLSYRLSHYGISATSNSNFTRSNHTRTKSSPSRGPLWTKRFSHQHQETAGSTCGTSPRLDWNKLRKIKRTVHQNWCLFMEVTRRDLRIWVGIWMRIGLFQLLQRWVFSPLSLLRASVELRGWR